MEIVEEISQDLFNIGVKKGKKKSILMYQFPRNDGKPYLGGAHGLIGILYMLLKASQFSEKLSENEEFMDLISSS